MADLRRQVDTPLPGTANENAARRWRRLALAGLVLAVALNAGAFAVRAWFVSGSGPYAATTGYEEFNLYQVWKVAHGHLLYEWPQKDRFLITHYNGAFYHVYAAWTKVWGADGAALVACARWLTPLFALGGVLLQVHLLRRLAPGGDRTKESWRWGLAFLAWFGPSFGGWWVLSVRADMAAVALAMAGFAVALWARETGRIAGWLASSLLFFAAWSFKQYVVWTLVGTVLLLLVERRGWRAFLALCVPFWVLAVAAIWWGGEIYRYNLFEVARSHPLFPAQPLYILSRAMLLTFFFWGLAPLAWADGIREKTGGTARALIIVATPSLLMGIVQLMGEGSDVNNILEGYVLTALAVSVAWLRRREEARPRILKLGTALLCSMAVAPLVQLTMAAHDLPYADIRGKSIGNAIKLKRAQLAQRERFAAWMQTLPKPISTPDLMLAQPWFANDNRFPAFLIDHFFEAAAWRMGLIKGEGFAEWIRRRYFASLLLRPHDRRLLRAAHESGYVEVPLPEGFSPLATAYGRDEPAPVLLLRTGEMPPRD